MSVQSENTMNVVSSPLPSETENEPLAALVSEYSTLDTLLSDGSQKRTKRYREASIAIRSVKRKLICAANTAFSKCSANHTHVIDCDEKYVDIMLPLSSTKVFHTNAGQCPGDTMTKRQTCVCCGLTYRFGIECDGACSGGTITMCQFIGWNSTPGY